MKFEGEHLLPGQIGHFFVLLAFVASIISTIAYFTASRKKDLIEKKYPQRNRVDTRGPRE